MSFYNNFQNINMSYLSNGLNNGFTSWFTPPFGGFQSFNWNFNWGMPSLFNFNNFSFDFSKMLAWDSPLWNNSFMTPNSNFNNFNWNNNIFSGAFYSTPSVGDSFSRSRTTSSLQLSLVDKAKSYVGRVNSDAEGNRLFSGGSSRAWCADFVSYNLKQTFGSKLPSFTHCTSVNGLREWGKNNGCYHQMPSSGKASYIAQNVKPGDIMIEKEGGKSHTGIVTKVNSDGSFETVEGNCSSSVKTQKYQANSPTLSGFISLDKFATA